MRQLKLILASFVSVAVSACLCASAENVDYDRAGNDTAKSLAEYLKLDTTNPPGHEAIGAQYLASFLKSNGIDAQIIPVTPTRSCVYARLKGTGKKKAIVLLNHIDVVPAEPKDWKYPPFGGEIHDGELWGRGALDMKGMGIIEAEAMVLLKRSGVVLDRDIIFLGTPDEEVGGEQGAKWFKEHKANLVKDAEFLLNEGFFVDTTSDGKPSYWGVDIAEKSVLWLQVKAKGAAGHASMPQVNSAPNRLVKALDRLVSSPLKMTVLPVVQQYFSEIAPLAPPAMQDAYRNLSASINDPKVVDALMKDPIKAAMLRNTVSLTVLKSGYKTNVIPAEAIAELDCRLLPSIDPAQFAEEIKKVLADPTIEVSRISWDSAMASTTDNELFRAMKSIAAEEKLPLVPVVVGWFTDCHWFRELGITSYGFMPVDVDLEHLATVHGKNERIPLAQLTLGVKRMHKVLLALASAR